MGRFLEAELANISREFRPNLCNLLEPELDHLYIARMELLQRLGLALVIGLLIGAERGWQERSAIEGERVAGIRTFGLLDLLGGLWALLAKNWELFFSGFLFSP